MERRKKRAKADFWWTPTFKWWVEEALYIGDYRGAFNKTRAGEECQAAGREICQVQVPERARGLSTNKRPLTRAMTSLSYLTHVHNHREHLNGSPDIIWLKKRRARSRLFCHDFNLWKKGEKHFKAFFKEINVLESWREGASGKSKTEIARKRW